jgi:hypothetical protein
MNGIENRLACVVAVALAAAAGGAHAAEEPKPIYEKITNPDNKDLYTVNIAVPTITAFSVIGVKDVAEVGADIAPDLYFQGGPSDGGVPEIGLSVRPYWVLFNPRKTIEEYQSNRTGAMERVFARTRVSLATANNAEGEGFAVGAGFNTIITGQTDPRSDEAFVNCVQQVAVSLTQQAVLGGAINDEQRAEALSIFLKAHPAASSNGKALAAFSQAKDRRSLQGAFDEALEEIGILEASAGSALMDKWTAKYPESNPTLPRDSYASCVKKATTRYQAAPAWAFGAGVAYRADERAFDALKYGGVSVWTTYRIPLFGTSEAEKAAIAEARTTGTDEKQTPDEALAWKGSLVLSGRYVVDDRIEVAGVMEEAKTGIAAVQFRAARGPLELSLTGAYYDRDYKKATLGDDSFQRYSVGLKTPIGKGLQVDLAAGRTEGLRVGDEDFVIFRLTATADAFKSLGAFDGLLNAGK